MIEPNLNYLLWLNMRQEHIYQGTVPQHVKAARRRRNKVARRQRRINRLRGC